MASIKKNDVVQAKDWPSKTMKLPSFFIVGAMKGGTTALYDHMCTHPQIQGGAEKEIHYFSLYPDRGLSWYADKFKNVSADRLTLDASPTYFDMCFGRGIPASMHATIPAAKLFLILRDPVARAISHFEHLKKVVSAPALKDVTADEFFSRDFAGALTQETSLDIYLFQVLTFSSYLSRFWTYRSVYSKGEMLVLDNDSFKTDPEATMRKVFAHAALDYHSADSFGAFRHSNGSSINQISKANFRRLADLLYPSYKKICAESGLTFTPLSGPDSGSDHILPRPSALPVALDDTVHVGREGWLFLTGGSNRPIDYYSKKSTPFNDKSVRLWSQLLLERKAKCEALGARYIHLLAPEKLSVYPEHCSLPLDLNLRPGQRLRSLHELSEIFIDPVAYFNKVKTHATLYWKTDTHWNYWGAFAAYQLLMARLGLVVENELTNSPFSEGVLTLDLGAKVDPPNKEMARYYRPIRDAVRTFANPLVQAQEENNRFSDVEWHVGTHVIYRNDVAPKNDKTVVVFGDSFSEYRPVLLTGLLAESFRETHFLWSSSIDFEYVGKVKPDVVISESAERFMSRIPSDTFSFDKFVADRLRTLDLSA